MRVRSLKKDKNDFNRLRHHRDRLTGFTYENEWSQPMPFFWTAEGNSLPLTGNFRGATGFIIASGPSLNQVDKDKLRYVYTMALNNAPKACLPNFRPNSWCTVDDPTRMLASIWMDPCITKFVPHAHAEKTLWDSIDGRWRPLVDDRGKERRVRQMPNVIYFHRNEKFMANRFLVEDTINWGCHSKHTDAYGNKGARSVLLPALRILYLLGFRTVYLVGVDFDMSRRKKYAFEEQRTNAAISNNNNSYKALNDRLKDVRKHFESAGYNVYNCNPDSKLEAFDHVPFDDAIEDALSPVSGINGLLNERSHGMYIKPEEKLTQIKK